MGQAQQNRRAVLIVEDDAELRGFAARLLEELGARGQDALALSSCDSHVRTSARGPAAARGRFYAQAVAAAQSPCGR